MFGTLFWSTYFYFQHCNERLVNDTLRPTNPAQDPNKQVSPPTRDSHVLRPHHHRPHHHHPPRGRRCEGGGRRVLTLVLWCWCGVGVGSVLSVPVPGADDGRAALRHLGPRRRRRLARTTQGTDRHLTGTQTPTDRQHWEGHTIGGMSGSGAGWHSFTYRGHDHHHLHGDGGDGDGRRDDDLVCDGVCVRVLHYQMAPSRSARGLLYWAWSTLLHGLDNTIGLVPALDIKPKLVRWATAHGGAGGDDKEKLQKDGARGHQGGDECEAGDEMLPRSAMRGRRSLTVFLLLLLVSCRVVPHHHHHHHQAGRAGVARVGARVGRPGSEALRRIRPLQDGACGTHRTPYDSPGGSSSSWA
jgi:hypothetical protein